MGKKSMLDPLSNDSNIQSLQDAEEVNVFPSISATFTTNLFPWKYKILEKILKIIN